MHRAIRYKVRTNRSERGQSQRVLQSLHLLFQVPTHSVRALSPLRLTDPINDFWPAVRSKRENPGCRPSLPVVNKLHVVQIQLSYTEITRTVKPPGWSGQVQCRQCHFWTSWCGWLTIWATPGGSRRLPTIYHCLWWLANSWLRFSSFPNSRLAELSLGMYPAHFFLWRYE